MLYDAIEKCKILKEKKPIDIDEKICSICLVTNFESNEQFLDYSNINLLKICECKAEVHISCFYNYIKQNNRCFICLETIYCKEKYLLFQCFRKIIYSISYMYIILKVVLTIFIINFFYFTFIVEK